MSGVTPDTAARCPVCSQPLGNLACQANHLCQVTAARPEDIVRDSLLWIQGSLKPGALKQSRDGLDALSALLSELATARQERDEALAALERHNKLWYERADEIGLLKEEVYKADDELVVVRRQLEAVKQAFDRCSPSACWSVKDDLAKRGVTVQYGSAEHGNWARAGELDYPVGYLARLAAELAVIFGQQKAERLHDLGTAEDVVAVLDAGQQK